MRGHGGSATERQAIEATVEQASSDLGARLAVDRQGAIGEIYAALGTTVLSYLQRLVGRDDAEDVLQRVFYEVWRHHGRYDPSRSLAGWVLGIARNRAIDHLRGQRNTAVALETLDDIAGEDGRELAERYGRSHEVRSALIRLPEEQREVLVLAYFGGYTQSEISRRLELPLGPSRRERSGACAASPNSSARSTRARPGFAAAALFRERDVQTAGNSLDQLRRDLGRGSTLSGRSLTASASGSTGRRSGCWRRCRASATRATSAIAGLLWTRVPAGGLRLPDRLDGPWPDWGWSPPVGVRRDPGMVSAPARHLVGGVGSGEFGWLDG